MPIVKPTTDFESTTFDVALAQGETGAITAVAGTGLSIPATNSYLQVDYNSTEAVGDPNGPETIFYATYTSGTGAFTGVVRGQAGTTDVAHDAGAEVQCAMSTAFLEDNTGWITVKDTWTYASASTITVPSGAAALYSIGDKIKATNTGVKYWYITAVADTVLTIAVNTDYVLVNAAITSPYYAKAGSPVGFPGGFVLATNKYLTMNGNYAKVTIFNDIRGDGDATAAEDMTYDFTFTTVKSVTVSSTGRKASSPATITDSMTAGDEAFYTYAATTSQTGVKFTNVAGGAIANTIYCGYVLVVEGIK